MSVPAKTTMSGIYLCDSQEADRGCIECARMLLQTGLKGCIDSLQTPWAFVVKAAQLSEQALKPQKRLRGCIDSAKFCAGKLDVPQATGGQA